ncbi:hypothetical protein [Acanthopleuribacter pedis]|uniref:Lipase n=1 Tax=Acanthopleuribacter pedis TaxID=442870 RepID=A0A8J7U3C2_9BACT|nr:hypothetical protein [Acanthopleuribacter pedis]MBO1317307.1 hypothetical protein [Acanthopleuribacter pedis]MBO1318614.1 hypothetical protein [Acanthopleuribacter pedis]
MSVFRMLFVCVFFAPAFAQTAPTLSGDFRNWLNANGYAAYDFARDDLDGGSFGGKTTAGQAVNRRPVIFVHGNGDRAWGRTFGQTGWRASRDAFLAAGYSEAELYATTWGPANPALASLQYHSYSYLDRTRAFIEAVLAYTGASQVDVITHSMGVTLARKAIKGGGGNDSADGGTYNLGSPLTARINTFIGIAGANHGLASCYFTGPSTPTCGATNGFYPGYMAGVWGPYSVSRFLTDLNRTTGFEGAKVYTIWSTVDEIVGFGGLVYGRYTARINGQDGETVYSETPYGHFNCKDLTTSVQLDRLGY